MSAERIKNAALLRFAAQGYDATSLAEIAGDVGIKTPSIYAHFKSKQELFLQLVETAVEAEIEEIRTVLEYPEHVHNSMKKYLYETITRFENAPNLRFWLRSIYLPPPHLVEALSVYDKRYATSMEKIVFSALQHSEFGLKTPPLSYETITAGFIGILRGGHAELLYGGNKPESIKRFNALWEIFTRVLVDVE